MRSRLLSIFIALFASVCLWLYVVNVVNQEDTSSLSGVPVIFTGEEDIRADLGLIITDGSTQTVNLKVSGKRMVLQKLSSENVSVRVDVSRIKKIGEYQLNYEIVFPTDVAYSDVSVLDRTPTLVSFTMEKLAKKTVAVKGVLDGKALEGYVALPMSYDVEEIMIEGPEDIVSQVSYAQLILSRTDLDKTVTATVPYTLVDANGNAVDVTEITTDVQEITVTQPVVKYKEIPLKVKFIPGGGATAENVSYTLSPEKVTVSGEALLLDEINELELDGIELAKITNAAGKKTIQIPIELPAGLKNLSGAETATVTVEIKGLDTKVIRVSNMEFVHIPQGYTPTSMTTLLQITIRAPSSEIGKISAADLRVVADLAEYTKEGNYDGVPVSVYVDGFPKAGAIGEYAIAVTLTKD